MDLQFADLPANQRIYLASDFHLGAPNAPESRQRERKIIRWLDFIAPDAAGLLLVGDLFDFWFDYHQVVPKGHIRFLAKIAELADSGIPIHFFTGNHDLWMFRYFEDELGIHLRRKPVSYQFGPYTAHIAHGDGLGPGDHRFKFFKQIFINKAAQWGFQWIHPDCGMWLANKWSAHSRNHPDDEPFMGEQEWLILYSKEVEKQQHHDFYIYGHRHIPGKFSMGDTTTYYNLGEWITQCNYIQIDHTGAQLLHFEEKL